MVGSRLHSLAKRSYLSYRQVYRPRISRLVGPARRVVEKEVGTWGKRWLSMPLERRLRLWRRGFMSRSDVLYDAESDEEYERYLSDYERERAAVINGDRSVALDNKLVFHWLMDAFPEHRVDTYGLVSDGRYHDVNALRPTPDGAGAVVDEEAVRTGEASGRGTADAATRVSERLRSEGSLVLKPSIGSGGKGVLFCSYTDGTYYVDGEACSEREFESRVEGLDEYLVTAEVDQTDYAEELYPDATNTLRILTMFDPVADEPYVPIAVQRIGTDRSAPVDNFAGGGLVARVDLETGELSEGAAFPYDGSVEWHDTHPDTGARIEGTEVTGWPAVREGILEMAGMFSHTPYIGWDVVITGDGEFAVIEANNCSDVNLLQIHEPLLDDPRARRFYEYHGVI